MKVGGFPMRTIWVDGPAVRIIDQTRLPHALETPAITHLEGMAHAIREMLVRGAPLIGAAAAHGVSLAMQADPSDASLEEAVRLLAATRPTAVNLRWALLKAQDRLGPLPPEQRAEAAAALAAGICDDDVATNERIARHGLPLLQAAFDKKNGKGQLNVLTHCNAGWLATVDWGTALAPVYAAHDAGLPVHVWVDETRPRNQGAYLTAWELSQHGVPHTVIADNTGGHLMQHGMVDLCIVGADRVTARGDVANKIGTYLKALAAHDNQIPFYAAVPSSTFDWTMLDGLREIPIEQRDGAEVSTITGRLPSGSLATLQLTPQGSPALNYGFDVTPARLITAIITDRGVARASHEALEALYSDPRYP